MQLHFREYGRGFPLLILHGLFGSSGNWQPIARRLEPRFHVLALDLRNHGQSPHSPEMNHRVMAEDVLEFMDSHSLSAAHLLGHSLGGKTAMQTALIEPQRIPKLVVADVSPRAYAPAHNAIFQALLTLDLKRFHTRQEIENALAPDIPDLAVRRFLLKNAARRADGACEWRLGLAEIFRNYPHLNEPVNSERPFGGPALFVRGGESDYVTERDLPGIRRLFPGAQIATIPGASHWIHSDAPDLFTRAVLDFLQSS